MSNPTMTIQVDVKFDLANLGQQIGATVAAYRKELDAIGIPDAGFLTHCFSKDLTEALTKALEATANAAEQDAAP